MYVVVRTSFVIVRRRADVSTCAMKRRARAMIPGRSFSMSRAESRYLRSAAPARGSR